MNATADKSVRANVLFTRNLLAGAAGLATAAVLVLAVLRLQYYVTTSYLVFSLFIFPVPVACGLAVGLVSPRRAVVWAPLWASIFALLLFALLAGGVEDAGAAMSPWRIAYVAAGVALAAFAGLVGQEASRRRHGSRVVVVFLFLCAVLVYVGNASLERKMREFGRDSAPVVHRIVNRDYIAVPDDAVWTCERRPESGYYSLSTTVLGETLVVLTSTDAPRIVGLYLDIEVCSECIETVEEARTYLRGLGFQHKLLKSLAKQRGAKCSWCASLNGTRLILNRNGSVRVRHISEPPA